LEETPIEFCKGIINLSYKKFLYGFYGKSEGRRPLGRLRCRWEHNIKIVLKGIERERWTGFIWLRV
jgi:hypothetical protein